MKRLRVVISGRVQGVFFRAYAKEKAKGLGIAGWIRNLPDGRVEAVFEGEKKGVDEMVKFCYSGSPGSFIEKVEVREEGVRGEKGFEIRY